MKQEDKAKAYDEAIINGSRLWECGVITRENYEYIFPELKESEDERIRKALIRFHKSTIDIDGIKGDDILAWLEKQCEKKQLYIRFGDVPSNETSKIYRGEVEIGDENGVSVYPAFEVNGNIVLGLTLPITKTTLYTQQHLLEYDNRPCYLVSGDYVGKGTDGEPLIRNISIIKRLDNYRIKEVEKQGEQKVSYTTIVETGNGGINALVTRELPIDVGGVEQNLADKIEPKFKVGDLIKHNKANIICKVISVNSGSYYVENIETSGRSGRIELFNAEQNFHLWTIQDAKEGDVLAYETDEEDLWIMIYWSLYEPYEGHVHYHALLVNDNFSDKGTCCICINDLKPATKEQRELLFSKMKEARYEWDAKRKKLKKIDARENLTLDGDLMEADCIIAEQKPTWSEEDDYNVQCLVAKVVSDIQNGNVGRNQELIDWLKSLKQKIGG